MRGAVLIPKRFNSDWNQIANRLLDAQQDQQQREKQKIVPVEDTNNINIAQWPPHKFNTIVNVCPRGYNMIVERFGRMHDIKEAGLFFAIPFVDRINYVVDTRELTLVIEPQSGVTCDNVDVHVGGALFVTINDPEKACYSVRRPLFALTQEAMAAMRTAIGKVTLDDLFHDRLALNHAVQDAMGHTTKDWGASVNRYELREIIPDGTVKEAMDKQAVAERTRRETVLTAQADREAIITRSEGERQGAINIAEGNRQQVVLSAEADAEKVKLEADAKAYAIDIVAKAMEAQGGRTAMDFTLASKYLESLVNVLPNSKMNTVFLPQDMGDLPKLMGTAMGIIDKNTKGKA